MKNQNAKEAFNLAITLLAAGKLELARTLAIHHEFFTVCNETKSISLSTTLMRLLSVEYCLTLHNCFNIIRHINKVYTILDLHELYLQGVISKKTRNNFYFYYDIATK